MSFSSNSGPYARVYVPRPTLTGAIATLLAALVATCPAAQGKDLVLIEAEAFDSPGGWVVDQQFMDQMGSPFVLAHGLGVPVNDATTTVSLPSPGEYRVWVRTRDWVAPWNVPGAPGRFRIVVDGSPLPKTFGTEGAKWQWHDGGTVRLGDRVEFALHDLTGFEGRCDAILLARDTNFIPPDGGDKLASLRSGLLGWDRGPADGGEYDLVVVGGGIAGTCAAITAARLGQSVALIQDRPALGGNGSSEVRVWPHGFSNYEPFPHVGDVVIELLGPHQPSQGVPDVKDHRHFNDRHKLELAQAEPNLTLMMEQRVNAARAEGGSIHSVIAQHTRSGRRTLVRGKRFLDSTGDGVLGALVAADFELAAEGRMGQTNLWSFGETEENEHALKCLCEDFNERISLSFTPAESAQPFPRCPWAADLIDVDFPGRNRNKTFDLKGDNQLGTWFWESGFNKNPIADGEWIRDLNFRAMYGAWDVLKNVDGRYSNHRLKWAAYVSGKRESRRLIGDVVLTAEDFRNATEFADAAFPCTWHIDVHSPHPDYFEENDTDAFFSTFTRGDKYQYKQPYWAPYRCLYSRNIDNLFMAGRDISVTQDGLGAVRVMRTCGMMGEIVGMASSICKDKGCTPREVYQRYLPELRALMLGGLPCVTSTEPEVDVASWDELREREQAPEWFRDAKYGIYFHWGVYSVPAFGNEWYPRDMHNPEGYVHKHHLATYGDPSEHGYDDFVDEFTAEHFDATEWIDLFARSGARFVGPVAEHHDGFALWDSNLTPWNSVDRGPRRDLLGEITEAARERGMKVVATFHHARNHLREENGQWVGHYSFAMTNYPGAFDDPERALLYGDMPRDEFLEMWYGKLREVIDRYEPDLIWFDSWLDTIPDDLRRRFVDYYYNSADKWGRDVAVTFKQEDLPKGIGVFDIEKGGMAEIADSPWLSDDTISLGSWCYTRNLRIKESAMVVHNLVDIVSKNGQLLLNVSPKADGSIPEDQRKVLIELGAWLDQNGEAIYETRPFVTHGHGPTTAGANRFGGIRTDQRYTAADIRYTSRGDVIYAIQLGVPTSGSETLLEPFGKSGPASAIEVVDIALVGSDEKIAWRRTDAGVVIVGPQAPSNQTALAFRMTTKGAPTEK
ncbi:alpha-L-fucosidase [Botrimarina hoheduenensis]|uniref:alpha-L-fucosidase n=1 Tax=Botrimarina hoheduenensis TaxID=2528000 RepID=A0A5C5VYJ8_9BACT|nr:alpha-L-fucosidase [Botrimarina hoheduenensis]TWT43115.1 tricarballylate dehydrogenase [Botrimarina hoheduenensis]